VESVDKPAEHIPHADLLGSLFGSKGGQPEEPEATQKDGECGERGQEGRYPPL